MTAISTNLPNIFSAESIRLAVANLVQTIQKQTEVKSTSLVLDANLGRGLAIAHYVFNASGFENQHSAMSIVHQTDKAIKNLITTDNANLFRNEVIQQFEVLRHYFRTIEDHGYNKAVLDQTYENNVYGLAKWMADNQFSMSKSVSDAFNAFNSADLKAWLKSPLNIDTMQNEIFLAVLLDILSHYSYTELKKSIMSVCDLKALNMGV